MLMLLIIITDNRNQVELLLVQTSLLSSSDIKGVLSNVEKKSRNGFLSSFSPTFL